jgi:hypothetical protein
MPQPSAFRTQHTRYSAGSDSPIHDSLQALVSDPSPIRGAQKQVPTSAALQPAAGPVLPHVPQSPSWPSSLNMTRDIELALKITFTDLFEWGDDGTKRIMLDRKAFLLYHPTDHTEQLDLITRWLLMHHVEVCSAWLPGGWHYYKQLVARGWSGIVIVSKHLWGLNIARLISLGTSRLRVFR